MIISQNTELKVMQALVKHWYKEFSVYELAREAKVTAPMVYKVLRKLAVKDIIIQNRSKVKISFNNLFSYRFKLLYDAERLSELPKSLQDKVNHVFQTMVMEYKQGLLAFIIFGSVASGESDEKSDIDLLVIVNEKKEIDYRKKGLLRLGDINIIEKSKNEFENEYLLAHDLILNALMNGIIIFDEGLLQFFMIKPLPQPSYEVIMQKKEELEHLKNRLILSLRDKDYKQTMEQFRAYLIQNGRILLLQEGIIPTSRKNILENLRHKHKELYERYNKVTEKNAKEMVEKYV